MTAEYLNDLKGGKVQIEILVRGKDVEENNKIWDKVLGVIKSSGVCSASRPNMQEMELTCERTNSAYFRKLS